MSVLVKRVGDFKNIHLGEKIIVCGCGTSLLGFKDLAANFITIGVNDVPALFEPTYLLVTDHPGRFQGARKNLINNSKSKHLFTCTKGWRHPRMVHFELGSKEIKSLDHLEKIDHFIHSPFVAVGLAYKMGAKHIGLIGVDFTDGHFYNPMDGAHPAVQVNYLQRINSAYFNMKNELAKREVTIHNLSTISRIDLPKITIDGFQKL